MGKQDEALLLFLLVASCTVFTGSADVSSARRDVNQADAMRARSRCVSCSVNGQLYDGHSRFQYEEGCNRFRCVCRCNGSWECPAKYTENICGDAGTIQEERQSQSGTSSSSSSASTGQRTDSRCRACVVNGKEHPGHSYFTHVEGCLTFDSCICYCNGSWVCPQDRAKRTCDGSVSSGEASGSATWNVEVKNNHSSSSSGSSFTSSERSSSSSSRSSNSSSSSTGSSGGSSASDASSVNTQDTRRTDTQRGCANCTALGKTVAGNTYFDLQDGCRKMKYCTCYCNGSWNCPDRFVENICGPDSAAAAKENATSCRSCSIKGKTFQPNQQFQITDGCVEYSNCTCNCDGSWDCPDSGSRNICNQGSSYNVDALSNSGCRQCEVKGHTFPGNQYFQLNDGCIEYRNCICRCDGSWNCPDTGAKNVCQERKEADSGAGSCRTCEVYGSSFPGNQYFQVKQGCVEYSNCICRCDGSWNCPDTGAKNVCQERKEADSGAGSCRTCEVYGSSFPGNQYFQVKQGCVEYSNCICRCDGSWNCPDTGAKNVCQERKEADSGAGSCRTCEVYGSSFPGNQYFQVKQGCVEYSNCICRCDGSWTCPDTGAKNVCQERKEADSGAGSCRTCEVYGSSFPGNQYFQVKQGCVEYSNCICRCDGSWTCPDTGAKNVCQERKEADSGAGSCRTCEVYGSSFPGNQYFQVKQGCVEYSNCICRCDGSWTCPDTGAKNVCQERKEADSGAGSCRTCEVYGSSFPGNQYFQVKQGCVEYSNCICYCNGSWQCPSDSAVYACDSKTASSSGSSVSLASNSSTSSSSSATERVASRTSILQCESCLAYGQTFKGGDYFDVVDGCTSYRNCICRCDSTWDCNSRFATNVCSNDTRRATETRDSSVERTDVRNTSRATSAASSTDSRCEFCNAKNKMVKGNTYFELTEGCIEYKNCVCRCDGSWECPPQYAKNVCVDRNQTSASTGNVQPTCSTCTAKGKIVLGNTYFELIDGCTRFTSCRCNCDGSWNCPEQRAQNICFTNTTISDNGCSLCKSSDGTVHQPNSRFELVEDCIEFSCDCFCNGSWSCPAKRSRWVCQDRCLQCNVDGRKIQNNTQFVHKTGCLEYTCDCHCNGSWSCPGRSVRNTCPAGVRDGCNKCTVSASEVYEGESDFTLRQDCLHYKCRCNCDGSYSCPGKDARNVCRGEVIGGCRSCAVSETEIHKGETDFTMRKDCIHYECRCNCDGGWECPSEKARNVCLGEVPGGCRACRVSETETYRANSVFDMRKDCIHYKCTCNCDGSWSCPGEDARDVCIGETPGGCKSCILSDNEFYPGNSNFEMVKNCIHYKCRCNCDGGYSCPGKTARRVCQSGAVAEAPTCRVCKVSEREQFSGNTTFNLERGCARYECECKCDGSWQCPPGKTRDICAREATRPPTNPAKCNPCKISKDVYPGNSFFKFTRGCSQFDCKCECSGRWSCDHKNRVNICQGSNRAATEQSLVSDASAVRRRQDIVASASTQSSGQTSHRGNTFVETDIQSQDAHNTQDQYNSRTNSSRTNSRSNSVVTSSGSSSAGSNCLPCNADGRVIQPNGVFSLDRGCLQYRNCRCYCDGRWQCTEEANRCETTQPPVVPHGERSHRTDTQSVSSSSSGRREVDSSAWVYVDGVDTSYRTGTDEKTGGGYEVKVDTKYSPTYSTRGYGRHHLEQLEERPHSPGSSSSSSTFMTSGSSPDTSSSTSHDTRGASQCQQCQVDSKTYPSGAHFDMRRGCVIYKCSCLCSGSYRCRLTSDNECSTKDKQNTCSNCLYQGMVFPGSMGFTVREGCEEKQCNCNCDGTHICHTSTPIPGCTDAASFAASFPSHANFYPVPGGVLPVSTGYITNTGRVVYQSTCTTCVDSGSGPVVYQTPVHPPFGNGGGGIIRTEHRYNVDSGSPRDTCPGCFVDGHKQNGNSTFAFRKECIEFDCFCACGGAWKCSGRLAIDCTPGFAPDTVPHTAGCRSCIVEGTSYPANAQFSLRQGCHEYKCSCSCDGGWTCPKQHPVNLCPSTPSRPGRGNVMDPQIMREESYAADQGANGQEGTLGQLNQAAHSSGLRTVVKTCYDCEVRGVTYPAGSKFFLRDGCIQRICDCHCNKTWSCAEKTVDICKLAAPEESAESSGRCRDCRVGSDVYVSGNDFQINNGCFQRNCHCHCNGTHDCPRERVRNICSSDNSAPGGERLDNTRQAPARTDQSVQTTNTGGAGNVPGCRDCYVDGQKIEALANFVKELGCHESLCSCQCNGQAVCPPSASVNICELPDKLPINQRPGCTVGRRTHFTRVFAHVENCIQRTCICHDDGQWSCKRSANDPKVC